jgi:oligopeptidase B
MTSASGERAGPRTPGPDAARRPVPRTLHGETVVDDYAWMRDRDDPELRAYLASERAHYDRAADRLRALVDTLADEAAARAPVEAECSVGHRRAGGTYRWRLTPGRDEPELLCAPVDGGTERVVLDVTALAAETGFAEIGCSEPSPDGRLLAWSVDTTGDEIYALRIRDLSTGEDLPETIARTSGEADTEEGHCPAVGWSADGEHLFYLVPDELGRAAQVRRHAVGESVADDVVVLDEPDQRFELTLRTAGSGELILITAASRDTTEVRMIPVAAPLSAPMLVEARRRGVEYRVDHGPGGDLYIVTDLDAPEFTLMRTTVQAPGREGWVPVACAAVAPLRDDTRLLRCDVVADRLVLTLRRDGAPLLAIADRDGSDVREIRSLNAVGSVRIDHVEQDAVLIADESMVQPTVWFRLDPRSGGRERLMGDEVVGYDAAGYRTERRAAPAQDGTQIPVTLVHRADTPLDGTAPCLLYGYGAYEASVDPEFFTSVDPEFRRTLPSLLDRGVVLAVAHIRGGGEGGRSWWQQGRLRDKPTTFTDHIAVADWLAGGAGGGLVDPRRIVSRGLSAGGLLQGAVYSQRPDRWCGVVAEVPFVDCVNTMLDPSIPLTVNEWDEWGDPRDPEDYACLRSYSPYENPPAGRRPPLLVTGALHDPRVGVHEPAKWVAQLRASDTGGSTVLFRVDLGAAGHTGPSGRNARFRYEAEIQAFILDAFAAVSAEA